MEKAKDFATAIYLKARGERRLYFFLCFICLTLTVLNVIHAKAFLSALSGACTTYCTQKAVRAGMVERHMRYAIEGEENEPYE